MSCDYFVYAGIKRRCEQEAARVYDDPERGPLDLCRGHFAVVRADLVLAAATLRESAP